MSSLLSESAPGESRPTPTSSSDIRLPLTSATLPIFAVTIFTSAFLLFQVQPLIGKFILPWFGGGPAVWTTCMLFFQMLLLAGYAYAHLSTRAFAPRTQALLHIVLLIAAVALLPITPPAAWKPVSAANPTWRILALLTVCLGLPYFVLAATGPLLQAWFSRLNPGTSPYRLYALSNVGSLLALVSYPFLFEPALARKAQAEMWSWGLGLFALLCGFCALRLWKLNPVANPTSEKHSAAGPTDPTPSLVTKALWLGLAACASVLLLSTTNKMCQDVAVIPFLWVLPLSLYLLSFIICFDSPKWYRRRRFGLALVPAVGALCLALFGWGQNSIVQQVAVYSFALFVCCMMCHGELYRLKPAPQFLTGFYLTVAAGGALGGLFVAVVAPLIFRSYVELHWGLWVFAVLLVILFAREKNLVLLGKRRWLVWQLTFAGMVWLGLILSIQAWWTGRDAVAAWRNFYGVLRVLNYGQRHPGDNAYILRSGETVHGLQYRQQPMASWPLGYYHEQSGVGLALKHFPRLKDRRLGLVGLGVGTLAAYGQPGDYYRFYEINPDVQRLAESHFTYLKNSKARVEVVLGDARLSLENEPPQQFDLLALDAFSSDAIPVHLLTREVFEIYLRHLNPNGVIAVHISNRHLNLAPVVKNLAVHFALNSVFINYLNPNRSWGNFPCAWVLLSRNQEFLNHQAIRKAATESPDELPHIPLWTDEYASLVSILNFSGPQKQGGLRLNQILK